VLLTWTALTACTVTVPEAQVGAGASSSPAVPTSTPVAASESVPSATPPSSGAPTSAASLVEMATAALAELDRIPVKGKAPSTGYRRSVFGRAWSDDVSVELGHNGCRTRDDVLRRDLTDVTLRGRCTVLSGWLDDPYTATRLHFERGVDVRAIQIDHVVALADAWRTGAQQWTPQKRLEFANDPRNLQATAGSANRQKSASNAASWLPPNRSYRCTYVARQIGVKRAYGLWVVPAEAEAMRRVLNSCV